MVATVTGTPLAITWAAGTDPAPQDITIPADCTAVYVFWNYFPGASSYGITSITLEGVTQDELVEREGTGGWAACGVAIWYDPTTGANQTLDITWDISPSEGPLCTVVFVTGGDTTAARDIDLDSTDGATTAVSVTLTSVSGDLILKQDQRYDPGESTPPSLSAGWTNGVTTSNVSESARTSYDEATGTTHVCDSEDESYSSIVAVSIPTAAGNNPVAGDATIGFTQAATARGRGQLAGSESMEFTPDGTISEASNVQITSVNGDVAWNDGDTGLIIAGSGFLS